MTIRPPTGIPLTGIPATGTPVLEVRGLQKSFGAHEVLAGIDLTVAAGEAVCILGPSGSGKSTLLRCLNWLEPPDGGSVSALRVRSPCARTCCCSTSRPAHSTRSWWARC